MTENFFTGIQFCEPQTKKQSKVKAHSKFGKVKVGHYLLAIDWLVYLAQLGPCEFTDFQSEDYINAPYWCYADLSQSKHQHGTSKMEFWPRVGEHHVSASNLAQPPDINIPQYESANKLRQERRRTSNQHRMRDQKVNSPQQSSDCTISNDKKFWNTEELITSHCMQTTTPNCANRLRESDEPKKYVKNQHWQPYKVCCWSV